MPTLADLVRLGYQVGVAFGDERAEHDRLAELEAACTDDAIAAAAQEIGRAAADVCRQRGMKNEQLIAAVADVVQDAHAQLTDHAQRALEHQRRAIEIAEQMPTVYRVEGFGVSLLVADDDTETLTALADRKAHKERVRQHKEATAA